MIIIMDNYESGIFFIWFVDYWVFINLNYILSIIFFEN